MSQERWDVVLRFLAGPLSFQGDVVCRGPVVRLGANPGPGGLKLDGYRGLDNRQAVITAYDGGSVSIAPVGVNQVRVAPHENVNWADLLPIRGPVYLDPLSAFHLGSPERGVTIIFVEAQRLGVWEQRQILSDASQGSPDLQPSNVKQLDTGRGIPLWFIPAVLVTALMTASVVVISLVRFYTRDVPTLGPVEAGEEHYKVVEATQPVDPKLLEGLDGAFQAFVMQPNADQARWPALVKNQSSWDDTFLRYVALSVTAHARAERFWKRLDEIADDYGYVVLQMRKAGLPEVFAAIPYHESQYRSDATSPVCAEGYWQFMPETAFRLDMIVRDCKMRGTNVLYTPTALIPVKGVLKNAPYVDSTNITCKIQQCAVDERQDLDSSTRGAVEALTEAWNDPDLAASGADVQLTILSHNAGYDDGRFDGGRTRHRNILPAYRDYLKETGQDAAPDFYGKNILCTGPDAADIQNTNQACGGKLGSQTQHYAYNIVAQHMLAVCYYAKNYGNQPAFKDWKKYLRGYCEEFNTPEHDALVKGGPR